MLVDAIKKEPPEEDEFQQKQKTRLVSLPLSSVVKSEPGANVNDLSQSTHHSSPNQILNIKSEPEEIGEEEILSSEDELYIDSQTNSSRIEEDKIVPNDRRSSFSIFEHKSSLSTLAEVSLATAGKLYEPHLNLQARANLYLSDSNSNTINNSKATEESCNRSQDLLQDVIPTIDLPQSVKDAIIASTGMSKTDDYSQSPVYR